MTICFTDIATGETYSTETELNLIVESVSIGPAQIKRLSKEIPGADGVLDYSDVFGEVNYLPRQLSIRAGKTIESRHYQGSVIQNALHGKMMKITLSGDAGGYYMGRVSVGEWAVQNGVGHVVISCTCQPWLYKGEITRISEELNSEFKEIIFMNRRKRVVPSFTLSAPAIIQWEGTQIAMSAGTSKHREIWLHAGRNTLKAKAVSGTATISIEYQEAGF